MVGVFCRFNPSKYALPSLGKRYQYRRRDQLFIINQIGAARPGENLSREISISEIDEYPARPRKEGARWNIHCKGNWLDNAVD